MLNIIFRNVLAEILMFQTHKVLAIFVVSDCTRQSPPILFKLFNSVNPSSDTKTDVRTKISYI